MLEQVFRAGETFPHDPAISEAGARSLWVEQSQAVMVAVREQETVVGTYHHQPNSLSLGAHVANAGYAVAEQARRRGIGSQLCRHSLPKRPSAGLSRPAVQPGGEHQHRRHPLLAEERFCADRHLARCLSSSQLGEVDAHLMFQDLIKEAGP